MTRLRVADRVGVTTEDGVVYAARLPDGPIVALEDTAAVIWQRTVDGPREDIAQRVSADVGGAPADIQDEVNRFVDRLIELGLLAPIDGR
jgi:hypothetical protein